jgi:hypothetical protein
MEAPTDHYKSTFSSLGPHWSHKSSPRCKNYLARSYSNAATVYKMTLPFRQGARDHFPLHHVNFLSSPLTPLKPLFIFNIKPLDKGLLSLRRGLKHDRS